MTTLPKRFALAALPLALGEKVANPADEPKAKIEMRKQVFARLDFETINHDPTGEYENKVVSKLVKTKTKAGQTFQSESVKIAAECYSSAFSVNTKALEAAKKAKISFAQLEDEEDARKLPKSAPKKSKYPEDHPMPEVLPFRSVTPEFHKANTWAHHLISAALRDCKSSVLMLSDGETYTIGMDLRTSTRVRFAKLGMESMRKFNDAVYDQAVTVYPVLQTDHSRYQMAMGDFGERVLVRRALMRCEHTKLQQYGRVVLAYAFNDVTGAVLAAHLIFCDMPLDRYTLV